MFQRRNKNCPFYYMTSSWQESYRTVKKICFCRFVDVCPFYALVLGILGLVSESYFFRNEINDDFFLGDEPLRYCTTGPVQFYAFLQFESL